MITKKEACRIAITQSGSYCIVEVRESENGYIISFGDELGYPLEQFPVFVSKVDGAMEVLNVADMQDELRKSKSVYIPVEFRCARHTREEDIEYKRRIELAYHGSEEEIEAELKKIIKK